MAPTWEYGRALAFTWKRICDVSAAKGFSATFAPMEHEYSTSFLDVNGVSLRVAVAGQGPPLLFLFGSGAAGVIENAKPLVSKFTDHFTVACPDQRGLGQSDVPPGPWTMADYAADAFGVADQLGWDEFSVIGLSFGGMVGLEMAATCPGRIKRMVLWGCSPGGSYHSYPLHEIDKLPIAERAQRFAEIMDTRLDGRWDDTNESPEYQLVKAVLEHGGLPWAAAPDEERERGLALQLEARKGLDVVDRLEGITCPTLIGAGTYDGLAPVCNAEVMQYKIPRAQLRVYDSGHFFYLGAKAFNDGFSFLSDAPVEVQGVGSRALNPAEALARLHSNP